MISFSGMVQLNEETSNRRPITLWLKPSPKEHPSMLRVLNTLQTKLAKEEHDPMNSRHPRKYVIHYPGPVQPNAAPKPVGNKLRSDKMEVEEEDATMVPVRKEMLILHGLSDEETRTVIR